MPADQTDEDRDWIDPMTWPAAAAHPDAVRTLTTALTQVLTPYAREHGTPKSFAALAVESLALAGRLLPDGGETRTEWGAEDRWPLDRDWEIDPISVGEFRNSVERYVASYPQIPHRLVRREIRDYPDGSSRSGPWVEVPDA